jgi:hypothetical protein
VGALAAVLLGLAVVLPVGGSFVDPVIAMARPHAAAAGLLLVRHAGTDPLTVDTTELAGPELRAFWYDRLTRTTVDAGPVPRGEAVVLYPPDTGDGASHDWVLVVVDATRGLVPPA